MGCSVICCAFTQCPAAYCLCDNSKHEIAYYFQQNHYLLWWKFFIYMWYLYFRNKDWSVLEKGQKWHWDMWNTWLVSSWRESEIQVRHLLLQPHVLSLRTHTYTSLNFFLCKFRNRWSVDQFTKSFHQTILFSWNDYCCKADCLSMSMNRWMPWFVSETYMRVKLFVEKSSLFFSFMSVC